MPVKRILSIFFLFSAILIALVTSLAYRFLTNNVFESMRSDSMRIASFAALQISADQHEKIISEDQHDSVEYEAIKDKLQQIADLDSGISSIYTYRPTSDTNKVAFVVDTQKAEDTNGNGVVDPDEQPAKVGELYDAADIPDMRAGFSRASADSFITTDKWGRWVSGYAPIFDAQGNPVAAVGVDFAATEYTQGIASIKQSALLFAAMSFALGGVYGLWVVSIMRKQNKSIIERKNFLDSLIKASPIGIYTVFPDGSFDIINPTMLAMSGEKSEVDFRKMNLFSVLRESKNPLEKKFLSVFESGTPFSVQAPAILPRTSKGATRNYFVTPLWDNTRTHVQRAVVLVQDVTNEVALQRKVQQYTKELETRVQDKTKELQKNIDLKNKLIHILSHQLRTPLSSATWNLELLLSHELGPMPKEQEEFLRVTYNAQKSVIARIHDLLMFTDIQDNRVTFAPENLSLENEWKSALVTLGKRAETKGVKIVQKENRATGSSELVRVDAEKLHAVLDAIGDNAISYTPEGGMITVEIALIDGKSRLTMTDTGIGIPAHEQRQIFTPFYRASNAQSQKTDASGLGLALSKYFVESQGGTISVASTEGKGTTVFVEFPLVR